MKIKSIITTALMAALLFGISLWCLFGEKPAYSDSERRLLATFPEITLESIVGGEFAADFEDYAVDCFPARDSWRTIKAYTRLGLFLQKDNNGIYQKDGYLSKLEYPMDPQMADHAIRLFTKIKEKYLTDQAVYFSMIPDKNCFLAELSMDYGAYETYMAERLPFAENISIADLLAAEDYYKTDTHWRQEQITDIADRLATAMGTALSGKYKETALETPFNGVYVGQSALICQPDTITYLTNETIDGFSVEGAKGVYDLSLAGGKDPYELFLSGNQPIITIQNPANTSGKRLILFRDSFGSSMAPLLAEGYSETVLVDLRYVSSDMLGQFVDFENADVLFLYSTLLLNSSLGMK